MKPSFKILLVLACWLIGIPFLNAQIPTPGFEKWENGIPVDWNSDRGIIEKTKDYYEANDAVKIKSELGFLANLTGWLATGYSLSEKA